jgi:hypothetical protein
MSSRKFQGISDQSLASSVAGNSTSRDASPSSNVNSNDKTSSDASSTENTTTPASNVSRRHSLIWYLLVILAVGAVVWFFWDMILALFGMHDQHHRHHHNLAADNWDDAPETPSTTIPGRRTVENPYKNTTFRDNQFVDSYNARAPQA